MMSSMHRSYKAFTLIEIVFALIISSSIALYVLKQNSRSSFYEEIGSFTDTLQAIIETAITDTSVGYPQGDANASNSCGDLNDYTDITAARVIDCVGWNTKFNVDGAVTSTLSFDGSQNYFDGRLLLGNYTQGATGCKIYIEDDNLDKSIFVVFVDCSLVYYNGEDRYKKLVEQRIESFISDAYSIKVESISRSANHINTTISGTDDDGKIRFRIRN